MTTQGVCAVCGGTKGCPTDSLEDWSPEGLLLQDCEEGGWVVRWVLCRWQMACRQGDALHPLADDGSEFPIVLRSLLEQWSNVLPCCFQGKAVEEVFPTFQKCF